jgi:peroxiredoxin Q/BCP
MPTSSANVTSSGGGGLFLRRPRLAVASSGGGLVWRRPRLAADSVDGVLNAGDIAPTFTLLDQAGDKVALAGFQGRKVLVYFYPKADTPGCTAQACGLRDILGDIGDTAVLGISPDTPSKQAKFDQKYGLGFPLLADEDHAVAEAYGVWAEKSMYGRKYMGIVRSAFLVDEKGQLAEVWYKISPKDTPKNLLAALAG